MNIYKALKIFQKINCRPLKLLGLWGLHVTGRRYIGVFLDPVMACNLRCRMCYMSDPSGDRKPSPDLDRLKDDTLEYVAETFFPRALKLQIGCATEPTLYRNLPGIVKAAKDKGVPYISITTNGQLLTEDILYPMIENGLNEVTFSLHGLDKEVYEDMMRGARFERLQALMSLLRKAKKDYPSLKIRINYVMNHDNTRSLANLYDILGGLKIDVLQLRPIQKLGESSYHNFSLDTIREVYDEIIMPIRERCAADGTVCLCPTKENLDNMEDSYDPFVDYLEELTYYYINENGTNKKELDWKKDSFGSYHKRQRTARDLWQSVFHWKRKAATYHSSRKMNYTIS